MAGCRRITHARKRVGGRWLGSLAAVKFFGFNPGSVFEYPQNHS